VVAEETAIFWNSFLDEFAKPVKESLIRGFAEVIRRQDNDPVIAEIEGGARQVNGFGEAGSPGPGEETKVGKLFSDA
jgi:hypothetical protein